MSVVVTVPRSLDEASFEQVLDQVAQHPPEAKLLLDARLTRWSSPYGLAALLTLAQTRAERPTFSVPEADETASYWSRAGFFNHAESLYDLRGTFPRRSGTRESSVLLEVTPVSSIEDVHGVVGHIQQKSQQILSQELKLEPRASIGFSMALSEICQNIVEHAGTGGWVAVQTYNWMKRLGRRVVVIAVCDAGKGFRETLESAPGFTAGARWNDGAALEQATLHGTSRYRDRGRGQGLRGTRMYCGRWHGRFSIRSGTARIVVSAEDGPALEERLAPFSGAQIQIIIPERLEQEPPR